MKADIASTIGNNLRKARGILKLSQSSLARSAKVSRTKIIRIESGVYVPRVDELLRIAESVQLPLQWFTQGSVLPMGGLQGIGLELRWLGIRDIVVEGAVVPGAFRCAEQVIALILRGDRPETRLIDAMPFVLATCSPLNAGLALAFADVYDPRARARLAWLSDVTLTLGRLLPFGGAVKTQTVLEQITRQVKKPDDPDDLGSPLPPGARLAPPVWRRWNITYGGTMDRFLTRAEVLFEEMLDEWE